MNTQKGYDYKEYLSRIGLSEVSRDVTPPVAPRAKKKNIPARSFGCKSFALALSSWNDQSDSLSR